MAAKGSFPDEEPVMQPRDSQHHGVTIELNPRERRFYDRMRAVVSTPRAGASGFSDLILLLPDVVVLLMRLLRDERVPFTAKALALLGVGYVLSPIDLVPEALLGPIGLIDDLLVVTAVLSRLMRDVHPDVVRSHWSGKGDALDAVRRLSEWSERQVRRPLQAWLRRLVGLSR